MNEHSKHNEDLIKQGWLWVVTAVADEPNNDGDVFSERDLKFIGYHSALTRYNEETKSLEVLVKPQAP